MYRRINREDLSLVMAAYGFSEDETSGAIKLLVDKNVLEERVRDKGTDYRITDQGAVVSHKIAEFEVKSQEKQLPMTGNAESVLANWTIPTLDYVLYRLKEGGKKSS